MISQVVYLIDMFILKSFCHGIRKDNYMENLRFKDLNKHQN